MSYAPRNLELGELRARLLGCAAKQGRCGLCGAAVVGLRDARLGLSIRAAYLDALILHRDANLS